MSILTISNLEKSFGVDLLFSGVNLTIGHQDKVGIVGRNGSGKTTLLRILMGQETPDSGRVVVASGRRIGYVKQEAPVHPEHTVLEEVHSTFQHMHAMEQRLAVLEAEMTRTDADHDAVMQAYSELRDSFDASGGYTYASDILQVLQKLGFSESDLQKPVGLCSGGEQTRLALAKIVLSRPDILILDEPTNHLDIEATEWLEAFLTAYDGAVVLVSHDRYFLDGVVNMVADLDNQELTVYRGNYSAYWMQKKEQIARQQALYEQQQDEIERLEDIIKKNMGADSVQSKLRQRVQGRIERMDKVERPREDMSAVKARFDDEAAGRVGREVVRLDDVAKQYDGRVLFSDLTMSVERGSRVGLVGPNGTGKTTLVRCILGTEQPTHGMISLGHNVRLSYFSQHAADSLDPARSVIELLLDSADMTSTEARNYLARFLFFGDDVFKTVGMLSGGEKNKLALARMILEPCNLLILDEPTNHLDIPSCEVLTQMLSGYNGTLLIVSHDRYLLNATTTSTLMLQRNGPPRYLEGNYAAAREMLLRGDQPASAVSKLPAKPAKSAAVPAAAVQTFADKVAAMSPRELSKARTKAREALTAAEDEVGRVELRIASVEDQLSRPSASVDDMVALAAEHTRLQDDLLQALTRWEQCSQDFDVVCQAAAS